ncbi:Na+/H+ antiporter family protein [Halalkalibacter hemicellulosilyticus]|uniref:Histidine permease YuiF n=1 Tax=Halalkalibacter hemicellulosilyticusJCM 9152 TaxID=1236971 RepID=W4QII6_9BACI|nr:Na+/H+ antiporter family protein [Halalkalibacter hemicellulosilyticus]GAE31438.1 histidine permease YuiF [Halalkalibacter hemicellulosilyticusJCM 9152]
MNAVLIAVLIMLILSLSKVHVVLALAIGALVGGLVGGLGFEHTMATFNEGLGGGASVALSYALLGAFAVAVARTGLPDVMVKFVLRLVGTKNDSRKAALSKALIFFLLTIVACCSQNAVPIHIAFIPILIPPILQILNELGVDRRAIATILTFGLTAPYIFLPYGFGAIFHGIIADNMNENQLTIALSDVPTAMLLPTIGLVIGLLIAVLFTYRKKRTYENKPVIGASETNEDYTKRSVISAAAAIFITLIVQTVFESMIAAALSGLIVLFATRSLKWKEADGVVTEGMKMMAFIGFVMLTASGFAAVIRETGHVDLLVTQATNMIGDNRAAAALLMLIIGLFITMGIGSSFATIPIIATLFVPLGVAAGFSPLAIIALIGTAGALGDAGAPASDSTLGPTAGLNADGQHNHIWDTCVPTFLHFNIPLLLFGWLAAMML